MVQDWNLFLQVLIFPPSNPIKGVAKKLIAYKGECWSFRTPGPCSASFQPSSSARDWRWTRRSIDCTWAAHKYRMGTIAFARGVLKAVYLSSYDEKVAKDHISHLADSLTKQYQSTWKRFQNWLLADCSTIDRPLVISYLVAVRHLWLRTRSSRIGQRWRSI